MSFASSRMALLLCAIALAAPVRTAAGPVSVRVGTNRALGTVTPYVGKDKGFFLSRGIALDLFDFQDGATLMEAFAAGQIDIAFVGVTPSAIWQQRGLPLKVVASANGGGHVLLTRADAGLSSVAQLRGRKVATPKPGTVIDTLFRAHIAREVAHLDPEKDLTIVAGLAPADMPAVLLVSREVDAAMTWEPFASQAEAQYPGARVLFDAAAEWRTQHPGAALYPTNVVVARQDLIDGRPEDLRRFLAAYEETVRFMNEQPAEANAIIARAVRLDVATVAQARRRIDYSVRVDDRAALQVLDWAKRLGYLKELPAPAALFDLRFLPANPSAR